MKRLLLIIALIINGAAFAGSLTPPTAAPAGATTTTTATTPAAPTPVPRNARTLLDIAIDNAVKGLVTGTLTLDQINPNSAVSGTKLPADLFEQVVQRYMATNESFQTLKKFIDAFPEFIFRFEDQDVISNPNRILFNLHLGAKNQGLRPYLSILPALAQRIQTDNTLKQLIKEYALRTYFIHLTNYSPNSTIAYLSSSGIDVNTFEPIAGQSLLRYILNKTFNDFINNEPSFVTDRRKIPFEAIREVINRTTTIPSDIAHSSIILEPSFPELLTLLVQKGFDPNNSNFVEDIINIITYVKINPDERKFSSSATQEDYDTILTNLRALLENGAKLPVTIISNLDNKPLELRNAIQRSLDNVINQINEWTSSAGLNLETPPFEAKISKLNAQKYGLEQLLQLVK